MMLWVVLTGATLVIVIGWARLTSIVLPWPVFLLMMVMCELPGIAFRFILSYSIIVGWIHAEPIWGLIVGALIGLSTPVLVVLALIGVPSGFLLPRLEWSTHVPDRHEQAMVQAAWQSLTPPALPLPRRWYVVDYTVYQAAFVIGTTLYIEEWLFRTPFLAPILAHELGHLHARDGRVVQAIRCLALPTEFLKHFTGVGRWIVLFAWGGISFQLFLPTWSRYIRAREFAADAYAAQHGQATGLIDAFTEFELADTAAPLIPDMLHPPSSERIRRLQAMDGPRGDRPPTPLS